MQTGRYTIVATAWLAIAGCGAAGPGIADDPPRRLPPLQATREEKQSRAPSYMPLSDGARWEYEVVIDLPLGAQKLASAVTRVDGQVEIAGKRYFKVIMQVHGAPVNPTQVSYYRPTDHGVFQILEGEEKQGEWLYLPKELKTGQSWNVVTPGSKFDFEVVGRNDLTCLGKSYQDCVEIKVEMRGKFGSITQRQWLAPGVGLVKQVDDHTLFDSTTELKKFIRETRN
ncbi:MAG TPA: hypothetical protein VHC19_17930, partial [Pirellulales bacterium]|nr:hypothetical protein [Pirellulales bacterium]